jgi:hypothetical protein
MRHVVFLSRRVGQPFGDGSIERAQLLALDGHVDDVVLISREHRRRTESQLARRRLTQHIAHIARLDVRVQAVFDGDVRRILAAFLMQRVRRDAVRHCAHFRGDIAGQIDLRRRVVERRNGARRCGRSLETDDRHFEADCAREPVVRGAELASRIKGFRERVAIRGDVDERDLRQLRLLIFDVLREERRDRRSLAIRPLQRDEGDRHRAHAGVAVCLPQKRGHVVGHVPPRSEKKLDVEVPRAAGIAKRERLADVGVFGDGPVSPESDRIAHVRAGTPAARIEHRAVTILAAIGAGDGDDGSLIGRARCRADVAEHRHNALRPDVQRSAFRMRQDLRREVHSSSQ